MHLENFSRYPTKIDYNFDSGVGSIPLYCRFSNDISDCTAKKFVVIVVGKVLNKISYVQNLLKSS